MSVSFIVFLFACHGVLVCKYFIFFFFKQKTAYEVRISDWSSDVCSSDLRARRGDGLARACAIARDLARAAGAQAGGAFRMRSRWVLFVPLAIMALLFGAFVYRLTVPAETLIESQWIDKPMPLFDLPPATGGVAGLKSSDQIGRAAGRERGCQDG